MGGFSVRGACIEGALTSGDSILLGLFYGFFQAFCCSRILAEDFVSGFPSRPTRAFGWKRFVAFALPIFLRDVDSPSSANEFVQ